MRVEHVIFDFGGVLYEIDVGLSVKAFDELFVKYPYCERSELMNHETVDRFERGHFSSDEFRQLLKERLQQKVSDQEIDEAWKKLLLGEFPGRTAAIESLSKNVPVSLLSNTSSIHFDHFYPECEPLFELFERKFLSFEMGLRKPEEKIYRYVLDELALLPEQVVFVDDMLENVQAAKEVGIHGLHLDDPNRFSQILKEIKGLI